MKKNLLSIIIDYQYDVSVVKHVGKNSYLPRPEIDSIVLKFEKVAPRFVVDYKTLLEVSSSLLMARRKTVSNNLKNLFKSSEEIEKCLSFCNIEKRTHIEQLSIKNIIDISNYLKK